MPFNRLFSYRPPALIQIPTATDSDAGRGALKILRPLARTVRW
jgi:hypothetical protein